ncbi:phospholipid carrier-dependent glycosyltransferase [Desulfobacula sp.]
MKRLIVLISFIFLILYVLPLDLRPLAIPDEVRYAEIPREMVVSGDWIVPRLNGLLYFEKPVMGYWLNGLAIKMFGETSFSVRITSAVSAGLSALMVFFLTTRFLNSRKRGILATSVFLTFFLVYGLGVFNVLDGMFSFFLTACIGFFFLAWSSRDRPGSHKGYMIIAGIFCGFAFLTKGFLAFAVPISVIVPFLLWERDYKKIFSMSWIPILVALIIALPWSALVNLKAPDYWHYFFWNEHVKRFFSDNAQHEASFFYFFIVLPGALLPWTFLAPASFAGLKQKGLQTPFLRYAFCWFFFPFLLFSISSGKLMTYILPVFPALGILLSTGLVDYLEAKKTFWFDMGVKGLMGLVGILVLALVILQSGMIASLHPFAYADQWKGGLFLAALIVFVLVLKKNLTVTDNTRKILLVAAAPLFFYFSANFLLPDQTLMRKCPGQLIERNLSKIDKNSLIFSPSSPIRAVNWYLKRDDVFMLNRGELGYGLSQKGYEHRAVSYEHLNKLAREKSRTRKIIFIVYLRDWSRIKKNFPKPVYMDSSGNDGFAFIIF